MERGRCNLEQQQTSSIIAATLTGRFTQDANAHRRLCENNMKANNITIINSEEAARDAAIDKCIKK